MSAFRATRSLLVHQEFVRPGKQNHFIKNLFTDTGNIPLVAANSAGVGLVLIFGLRKLFYHPDISVAESTRCNNTVQNETSKRLEDADAYREHHIKFAAFLEPLAIPFVRLMTGSREVVPKWSLSFAQTPVKDLVPLERTNFFDDGTYTDVEPSSLALNENNQDLAKYRI